MRVADEIQSRHTQSLFVYGVVIQRITVVYKRRADDCKAVVKTFLKAEIQIIAGSYNYFLAVGKIIIERAPEVKVSGLISYCSTHLKYPYILFKLIFNLFRLN